ncbi:MAG: hypothetical protein ACXU87_13560, partial [Xanthobacteraceae bacterium]
ALQAAIDNLLLAGFDRADLGLMAGVDSLRRVLRKVSISIEELTGTSKASRGTPVLPQEVMAVQAMIVGTVGFFAAAGAAWISIASGAGTILVVIATTIAGSIAAALGGFVFARRFKPKDVVVLDDNLRGGAVLWVRVRTKDQEAKARQILANHGAKSVRVVETEIAKTTEDIPMSRLRPDPFIPVRLGEI